MQVVEVEVVVVMMVLSSSTSPSPFHEAGVVLTAKAGFVRQLQSQETQGFLQICPSTQGQRTWSP